VARCQVDEATLARGHAVLTMRLRSTARRQDALPR
jgi:hypothetical protein